MNFTHNDLQNIILKKSLMGFNSLQVEDVIQKVVEDFTELIKENAKLKEKLEDNQEKLNYYKRIENNLQNSLIVAQQTSEDIVSNARKSAENITKEAEMRANQIIEEANRGILDVRFEYERIRREVEAYKAKVVSIIHSQLKALDVLDECPNIQKKGDNT